MTDINSLEILILVMRSGNPTISDWTSLPTFGGAEPDDTSGVWSWDETHLLVGTCADDLMIVERGFLD